MTLESFMHRTFPPLIGSMTSPSADKICQKNNLTFVQLVQPFTNVSLDYMLKDPSGSDLHIKHLKVGVKDVNERLPSGHDVHILCNEAVASSWCDVTKQVPTSIAPLDVPDECPWFDAWSDAFLQASLIKFFSYLDFCCCPFRCSIHLSMSSQSTCWAVY